MNIMQKKLKHKMIIINYQVHFIGNIEMET